MSLTHIFDSHAHYDDARFSEDVYELLDVLPEKGVSGVISCGVNTESTHFAQALAQKYAYIYAAAGFHPLNLEDVPEKTEAVLRELLKAPKTVAVGEIGLDYHYEKESRKEQLALFEMQLHLAKELDLPVIVHDREPHVDTGRGCALLFRQCGNGKGNLEIGYVYRARRRGHIQKCGEARRGRGNGARRAPAFGNGRTVYDARAVSRQAVRFVTHCLHRRTHCGNSRC